MKLYATTTSERGKPVSKGGNEKLYIYIINENREPILTVEIDEGIILTEKGKKYQMVIRNWIENKETRTIFKG